MAPDIEAISSRSFEPTAKSNSEYTVPETLEQNSVAERYIRTIVQTARRFLID